MEGENGAGFALIIDGGVGRVHQQAGAPIHTVTDVGH
jgi:hypothetical protein